ncbi:MAG TPA: hypothetical protein VGJ04_12255, partial [Pirellulales bacterium]
MRGILWGCAVVTTLLVCLSTHAWADTIINGSALSLLSYSSAASAGTTTFGSNGGTTAQFKTDGYGGTYIYLPTDGAVTFTANASGTPYTINNPDMSTTTVDPHMTISIADYSQSFTVNAANGPTYTFTTPQLHSGYYFVRTQLDNQAGSVTPQLNLASLQISG